MAYGVRVLRDSVSPDKLRLTTLEVTLPRIVLAEFNTHRVFSRNSASSRAIPVEKMLKRVEEDPFVPIYWGKNQKGMQADEELSQDLIDAAEETWLAARDHAVYRVKQMVAIGVHKQIANRMLEPWLWHTIIVTSTEWGNFFGLRRHKDAQPEIKRGADVMWEAYQASFPSPVNYGDWHLPLVEPDEAFDLQVKGIDVRKVSAGRCARVSYLTHDGKRDPQADIDLCERLIASGHMSPLEHVARPLADNEWPYDCANFRGWMQFRREIPHEGDFSARPVGE